VTHTISPSQKERIDVGGVDPETIVSDFIEPFCFHPSTFPILLFLLRQFRDEVLSFLRQPVFLQPAALVFQAGSFESINIFGQVKRFGRNLKSWIPDRASLAGMTLIELRQSFGLG
jgi:hypothetical protein